MKKSCLIITGLLVLLILISVVLTLFQKNIPLRSRVALIRIEGPIIDSKDAIDEIKEYIKDHSVKAIVLRVDSPGGAVAPSQEIYEEVKKAVAEKPVVVSMGSVAASGGYYISAPASKIIANPGRSRLVGVIMNARPQTPEQDRDQDRGHQERQTQGHRFGVSQHGQRRKGDTAGRYGQRP
jgi:protease-4